MVWFIISSVYTGLFGALPPKCTVPYCLACTFRPLTLAPRKMLDNDKARAVRTAHAEFWPCKLCLGNKGHSHWWIATKNGVYKERHAMQTCRMALHWIENSRICQRLYSETVSPSRVTAHSHPTRITCGYSAKVLVWVESMRLVWLDVASESTLVQRGNVNHTNLPVTIRLKPTRMSTVAL